MSNQNPTNIVERTDPQEWLLRFQRALFPPLGDDGMPRTVSATVTAVGETTMLLKNVHTEKAFELPLDIFRLIPRVGEYLVINRVHHRIYVKEHRASERWYQIQVML